MKTNFLLALVVTFATTTSSFAGINDFLEKKEIKGKIRDEIARLDIGFSGDIFDIDLAHGVGLSTKYKYEVEPSYMDKFYTRIDKWDVKADINVGDIVENFVELPLSFSVARQRSFFFVRQFKTQKEALIALPYTPKRIPVNGDAALKNLAVGDFVSMPASLTLAVGAGLSTTTSAPVIIGAKAGINFIIGGEFTIQVYRVDETHVRLKLISSRGYSTGVNAGGEVSFKLMGLKIVDRQIDRLFDRDLINLGYNISPGAQFIIDYVFDLSNPEAKAAYNQILSSNVKFKDVVILNELGNAEGLKDKLISSFEKAEALFEADKLLDYKDRRVSRIFKGFNNSKAKNKRLKIALLVTSFKNEKTYTENKITYTDKNENSLEFFYPTYSKYIETNLGKWFFELKDQSFQNNFGLIPRHNSEDSSKKAPDFGLNFERKDSNFTKFEQKVVQKFIVGQMPTSVRSTIDFRDWKDEGNIDASLINFKLILKAQGFEFLKGLSRDEITKKLIAYSLEKQKMNDLDDGIVKSGWDKLKNFLFINRFIKNERLKELGSDLYKALQNQESNSEIMLTKLVKLNEHGVFDKIGVGFLISLLPQNQLKNLIYIKLDMVAQGVKRIDYEFGTLNYRTLYNELSEIQSRLSYRSYDLRVTAADHDMEDNENKPEEFNSVEEILGLN
jgi:hypothetical protein